MSTNQTTEISNIRGTRGSRGRVQANRGNSSERPQSPREKNPSPQPEKEESSRPIRGSRGSRISRPRGRGRVVRRENNRPRQPFFRRRFRRPLNFMRNRRPGRRGGFRRGTRNFRFNRRLPGNRSIFIKGFPLRMSESTMPIMWCKSIKEKNMKEMTYSLRSKEIIDLGIIIQDFLTGIEI